VKHCLTCGKPFNEKRWYQRFCPPVDGVRVCANRYGSREFYRKHYAKDAIDPRQRPARKRKSPPKSRRG